jgi:hypothetical protein
MSERLGRTIAAIVGAGILLVIAGWLDTVVLVGIKRSSESSFDIAAFVWSQSFGFLAIAGAVLAVGVLGLLARSLLVGVVYALVGALLVFLGPIVWLGAASINGADPILPEPITTLVNNLYFYGEQGPLNAVAIIGAGMLLVGIVSISDGIRHRAPAAPEPIATSSATSEVSPDPT